MTKHVQQLRSTRDAELLLRSTITLARRHEREVQRGAAAMLPKGTDLGAQRPTIARLSLQRSTEDRKKARTVRLACSSVELPNCTGTVTSRISGTDASMPARWVIFGERQALAIALHLQQIQEIAGVNLVTFTFVDSNSPAADQELIASLDTADSIILQVGIEHLLPITLANRLLGQLPRERCLTIPILVCRALWPFDALDSRTQQATENSPLRFTNGDRYLQDLQNAGSSAEEAASRYCAEDVAALVDLDALLSADVQRWRATDTLNRCQMAAFLEEHFRDKKLFLASYSPSNRALQPIIDYLIGAAGLPPAAASASDRLLATSELLPPDMPIHPSVLAHFGVTWAATPASFQLLDRRITFAEWACAYVALPPPEFGTVESEHDLDAGDNVLRLDLHANDGRAAFFAALADWKVGQAVRDPFISSCLRNYSTSKAQLFQDVFVLNRLSGKRNGYFVEFGATDGLTISNTILLEQQFGWTGILAEPLPFWHEALHRNRSCVIDHRCVWSLSGERVGFGLSEILPEISTMIAFRDSDRLGTVRRAGFQTFEVETVSLNDLLETNNAPADLDYLSIDTEGSEFIILDSLNFERYRPKIITVEHNFNITQRSRIRQLMRNRGYVHVYLDLTLWDDWFVVPELAIL